MIVKSKDAEYKAVINAACEICAAARTAPKTKGIDQIETAIIVDDDKTALAEEMRKIAKEDNLSFFDRDANNIQSSAAVVLIGTNEERRNLGKICGYCHYDNCSANYDNDGCCSFDMIDLGIAIGSAASKAADLRIDNRVMFSAGKAAANLALLGTIKTVIAIPLSVGGKSPYFDR